MWGRSRPKEHGRQKRQGYIRSVSYPRDFLQWDELLDPPVWAVAKLSTGERLSCKFRYLSRDARYSFELLEYNPQYRSWKARVVHCDGIPEEENSLERILCHRSDAKLTELSESVRNRLLEMVHQAPWLFCFPWSHPYGDIIQTPTLEEVCQWHPLSETDRSALQYVEQHIHPEFQKGHVYLLSKQLKNLHEELRKAIFGHLGLLAAVKESDEWHYYPHYDLSVQRRIISLEHAAFKRPIQSPPRDFLITGPLSEDPDQLAAVQVAFQHRKVILMGGAGTGKTTVCRELARQFGTDHVLFVAFTGKAAQRLEEVVGSGCTIHSLTFVHKYLDHLPEPAENCHIVVIDEMSMVDLRLYVDLLECLPHLERIIMVGDSEQLHPVERGCPFVANLRRYFPLDTPRSVGLQRGIVLLRTDHRTHPEAARLAENHERIFYFAVQIWWHNGVHIAKGAVQGIRVGF